MHRISTRIGALFSETLGCGPCFSEALRLVQEWAVPHLNHQNLKLIFTRVVARLVYEA